MIAFDSRCLTQAGARCFSVTKFVRKHEAQVEYIRILTNPATLYPRRSECTTNLCADFVPVGARHWTPVLDDQGARKQLLFFR
jgi:hypothetical protein